MLKAVSLFSGMGGDTLGMTQAGCEVVAFNEFDRAAIETHLLNFPDSKLITHEQDSNILHIPDETFCSIQADILFAGHPCQGFSNGGKKLPDDPRNTLFREFVRCAKCIQPKYIIGENVDGLLTKKTSSGERFIDVIVSEFDSIGYKVVYQVCHTVHYGVPQTRKRLVYVGVRKDLNKTFEFKRPDLPMKTIQSVVKFSMEGAIRIDPADFDMTTLPTECILTDLTNEDEPTDPHPYLTLKAKTRNQSYKDKTYTSLLSFGKRDSPIHAEIVDIRKPSKTIICTYDHQPRLFVPLRNKNGYYIRCLLPDELKQIQGFPPEFQLSGTKKNKIKQIGNAAPPPLVKHLVEELIHLDSL